MNLTEEFNKMSLTFKHMVISVATLVPFWLIAIYLLNRPFYNSGDLIIIGAFCFCFSVTWYLLALVVSLAVSRIDKRKMTTADNATVGGIVSMLYLALIILLAHLFEWSFTTFLIVAYCYAGFSALRTMIRYEIKKQELAQNKKKQLSEALAKKESGG